MVEKASAEPRVSQKRRAKEDKRAEEKAHLTGDVVTYSGRKDWD